MSYNLRTHWAHKHTGAPFPGDLQAQIALKDHEKGMLAIHRGKKPLSKREIAGFTATST